MSDTATREGGISRQGQWAARQAASGLCRACTRPAQSSRTLCGVHLLYKNRWARRQRLERAKAGLCRYCERPHAPHDTLCPDHRAYYRADDQARRQKGVSP
jgi:hypothetical protein